MGGGDVLKEHLIENQPMYKSGYLYVYVTNETPNIDVYFDNLQVTHIRGPLLEENHYYPFGLTMAGISSKALAFGQPENKVKFQGQEFATKEFSDGSGIDMYEFKWRMHDPQIGRFWQVDPLSEDYVYNSTYAFSENKVISHVELEGLEAVRADEIKEAILSPNTALISNMFRKEANKVAKESGLPGSEDGLQDAFRHAYWTARNAQHLSKKEALRFPNLHETGGPQNDPEDLEYNPVSVEMDLHNNKVGAEIGAEYTNSSQEDIKQLVMNALISGKLKVVKTTTANISEGEPVIVELPADKDGNPIKNGDKTKKVLIPSSLPNKEEKKVKKEKIDTYKG